MGAPAGVTGLKRLLLTLALIITLAAGSVSCTTGGGSTPDDQPTVAHVNRRSIGERLARESLRLADTEPRLSVLFALEAAALTQSPLVADALNRLRSPHPVTHFRLGSAPVRTLRFSTDGRLLIGASTNGDVRVWDTYTGRTRLSARLEGPVTDAVVDYPSDLAAARSATGEVRVWHLDTGRLARRFDAAPGRAGGLVFVPGQLEKDLLAFSGRHGSIEVWDTGNWHRKAKLHPTGGSADLTR